MRRRSDALPLVVLLLAAALLPAAGAEEVAPAYVARGPISIAGDAQLRSAALAGGWPGSGSPADPFVIQGYDIAGGAAVAGIWIRSTTLSVTIRDNRVQGGGHGMLLQSMGGAVRVLSNVVDGAASVGIYVLSSTATVAGNTVTGPGWTGINVLYGTYAVTGNAVSGAGTIPGGGYGMLVAGNAGSLIDGNAVAGVTGSGVLLSSSTRTTLSGNTIDGVTADGIEVAHLHDATNLVAGNAVGPGAANGIHVHDASQVRLAGNTVREATVGLLALRTRDSSLAHSDLRGNEEGMRLDTSTGTTVRGTTFAGNGVDLHLLLAHRNLVFDNRFLSPTSVRLQLSSDNLWNATKAPGPNILGGPFLGGNAWPDYTGVDADLDGLGEVPHGPLPYGAVPRHTAVEDAYASLFPYGPYDQRPLMRGPVAAGALAGLGP